MANHPTHFYCWLTICVVALSTPGGCKHFMTIVPPESATTTNLVDINQRIDHYWQAHNRLPESFNDLPKFKDKVLDTDDGWGRPFYWESDGESWIVVYSLGEDGEPGGEGANCRYSITFDVSKTKDESLYYYDVKKD